MDKLTILRNYHAWTTDYIDSYTIIRSSYPIYLETSNVSSSTSGFKIYSYNNGVKTYMKHSHPLERSRETYVYVSNFVQGDETYLEYSKPQYRWYFIRIL